MIKTHVTKNVDFDRKWYLIDADGVILGRLAVIIADLLRGKNKPNFSPSVDCGDYVVVVNSDKIAYTGAKLLDKKYYNYSGHPGGMRELTLEQMLDRDSTEVIRLAVKGMLPKNRLAADMIGKLKVFPTAEHAHTAQKPEVLKVEV